MSRSKGSHSSPLQVRCAVFPSGERNSWSRSAASGPRMQLRARPCSISASVPAASPKPPSACARGGGRPRACRWSRPIADAWLARCGNGTWRSKSALLCCSGHSPCIPIGARRSRRALMQNVLTQAEHSGHAAVLLVGDAPYYARFGFSAEKTSQLLLPGTYERDRLLACELKPGALDGAHGLIVATGLPVAPFSRRVLTPAPARPVRLPQAA